VQPYIYNTALLTGRLADNESFTAVTGVQYLLNTAL